MRLNASGNTEAFFRCEIWKNAYQHDSRSHTSRILLPEAGTEILMAGGIFGAICHYEKNFLLMTNFHPNIYIYYQFRRPNQVILSLWIFYNENDKENADFLVVTKIIFSK